MKRTRFYISPEDEARIAELNKVRVDLDRQAAELLKKYKQAPAKYQSGINSIQIEQVKNEIAIRKLEFTPASKPRKKRPSYCEGFEVYQKEGEDLFTATQRVKKAFDDLHKPPNMYPDYITRKGSTWGTAV